MEALNRLFVVLRIPEELRATLEDTQLQIRRKAGSELVRWTPPAELMMTLMALGEISVPTMARIGSELGRLVTGHPKFQLCLDGLGGLPNNLQPRSLFIGVSGDTEELKRLQWDIERGLMPHLTGYEQKTYLPHIPIGRLKQESEANRSALGRSVRMAGIGQVAPFTATAVELVRSAVTGAGPTLVTVSAYPLD